MRMRLAGLMLTMVAVGCSTESLTTAPSSGVRSEGRIGSVTSEPYGDREDEAHLRELSARVPGFAGLAISSDGSVVLLSTRPSEAAQVAQREVGATMRRRGGWDRAAAVKVREARFTFTELERWRDAIAPELYVMAEWASLDLDEVNNVIAIGTIAGASHGQFQRLLASKGVPAQAVRFEDDEVAIPHSYLTYRHRPLRGGLMILRPNGSSCTLGLMVTWGGTPALMTNSHCTQKDWSMDNVATFFRQGGGTPQFGPELKDRGGRTCGVLNLSICRRADVAMYGLNGLDVNSGETAWSHGQIVRPTGRTPGSSEYPQILSIDVANPFVVASVREHPIGSETIDRVGSTTGWKYGQLTHTCTDRNVGYYWLRLGNEVLVCQSTALTGSRPGDSGGPTFMYFGHQNVMLIGLNWGASSTTGQDGHFSSVRQIRSELYQQTIYFFPGDNPPPPPTATIYGPLHIKPTSTNCFWTAASTIPDAEYTWLVDGVMAGTGGYFYHSAQYPFTLTLQAAGSEAYASVNFYVSVSNEGYDCYDY